MGTMIKPIETEYNGYRFRSRLEARWAVFFDAIGADWEYEPEGYELPDGTKYLPDFHLFGIRGRGRAWSTKYKNQLRNDIWVEIKGEMTDEDMHKISIFSCPGAYTNSEDYSGIENPIIVFGNLPKISDEYHIFDFPNFDHKRKYDEYFYNLEFSEGDYYWTYPCAGIGGGIVFEYPDDPYDYVDKKKTAEAYKKARQARFEHGENGGVS